MAAPRPILSSGVLVVGLCLGLAGCGIVNVEKYYTPEARQTFSPTQTVAVIDGGEDAEAAYKTAYENRSYQRIGRVSFVGQHANDESMIDFGKRIGADVVVVSRRVVGSHVVENPQGPDANRASNAMGSGADVYGANEPKFDPAYTPAVKQSEGGPASYVVRDYRQVAIYLRRVG
jgi:hypothetical protein